MSRSVPVSGTVYFRHLLTAGRRFPICKVSDKSSRHFPKDVPTCFPPPTYSFPVSMCVLCTRGYQYLVLSLPPSLLCLSINHPVVQRHAAGQCSLFLAHSCTVQKTAFCLKFLLAAEVEFLDSGRHTAQRMQFKARTGVNPGSDSSSTS